MSSMQGKGHNWVESMTIAKGCKVGFRCKVELATIMTQLGVGWLLILVACIVAKQPYSQTPPQNTHWVPPFVGNLEATLQKICGHQSPHIFSTQPWATCGRASLTKHNLPMKSSTWSFRNIPLYTTFHGECEHVKSLRSDPQSCHPK